MVVLQLTDVVEDAQTAPHLISEGAQAPGSRDRATSDLETAQWGKVETEGDPV